MDREIEELVSLGYVVNPEEVLFAVRDQTGQIIWLAQGSENAGLKHIILRHLQDFFNAIGIKDELEIIDYLKRVISDGTVVSNNISKNGTGFDRTYDYCGNYYVVTAIGSNGFVVTAFPVSKE